MSKILVVGAGLAGLTLSERLLQKGVDISVIANPKLPSSTGVATGMFNPIVFKRLNKTWMIDEVLPSMHSFYNALSQTLNLNIKQDIQLFKHIASEDYHKFWDKRAQTPEYSEYLNPVSDGLGEVLKAGIIDCPNLYLAYMNHLEQKNLLITGTFDHSALQHQKDRVIYKDEEYKCVVFCEGPYAANNPYFQWLPFKVAKGDWVIVQTRKDLRLKGVMNNIVNIIPLGNQQYKLSSTFEWDTTDWTPNPNAIPELTQAFEQLFDADYTIIDHKSGLRPAASDRRPYLGAHPRFQNLYIFNGLGSKGVILAPYFSKHLADHILNGTDLLTEVDIKRHIKRFREMDRVSEIS